MIADAVGAALASVLERWRKRVRLRPKDAAPKGDNNVWVEVTPVDLNPLVLFRFLPFAAAETVT